MIRPFHHASGNGTAPPPGLRRLVVVSHVTHFRHDGLVFAYGPYAREIEMWADLCGELVIAAPCRDQSPPPDCLPVARGNVTVLPQKETGGTTLLAKLRQAAAIPGLAWTLCRAMRGADGVHVRCPGNLGLLGAILAPLMSRRVVAKYAGQWTAYPGEAWSYRLQRAILRSRWWRGPVTVYGQWPNEPAHVVPFFTSILTAGQVDAARTAAQNKRLDRPLEVLYVGRLSRAKNVDLLITAVGRLRSAGIPVRCTILGDGPRRPSLESQAAEAGLGDVVRLLGAVDFDRVLKYYQQAHVLVLASQTEGWPKAIAEAMAFGLVCIGSQRGMVPEMLGEQRGLLVPPGDVEALTAALRQIAASPQEYAAMSARAAQWGQRYSLEELRDAIRDLLSVWWGLPVCCREDVPPHKEPCPA